MSTRENIRLIARAPAWFIVNMIKKKSDHVIVAFACHLYLLTETVGMDGFREGRGSGPPPP